MISEEMKLSIIEKETFKSFLSANLILPGEEGYDKSRTIWNGIIDKFPAVVVKFAGPSDIIAAVRNRGGDFYPSYQTKI